MEIKIQQKLRELRKEKGNTQENLAQYLGITVQSVSKWERGDGMPDISLLPLLSAYYNVSIDTLLGVDKMQKICEYRKSLISITRFVAANPIRTELWLSITVLTPGSCCSEML